MAKGEAAARDIEAGKSGHASTSIITIQIDIQDDTSIEKVYDLVNSEYGRVDTLINNAGSYFSQHHTSQLADSYHRSRL